MLSAVSLVSFPFTCLSILFFATLALACAGATVNVSRRAPQRSDIHSSAFSLVVLGAETARFAYVLTVR